MSLKDNAYNQGADDALKNLISEMEMMLAIAEEEGVSPNYIEAVNNCITLTTNMRKELY